MQPELLSFLYFSHSKQQTTHTHTPMSYPCSPWRNWISACARRLSL